MNCGNRSVSDLQMCRAYDGIASEATSGSGQFRSLASDRFGQRNKPVFLPAKLRSEAYRDREYRPQRHRSPSLVEECTDVSSGKRRHTLSYVRILSLRQLIDFASTCTTYPSMRTVMRSKSLAVLGPLFLLGSCGYMQPAGSDWHRTRKVSVQVCVPAADLTLRAGVALHRRVEPALQRAGFASVLGGDPYPAKTRTTAGDPVFASFWESPSNSHHLITVQLHRSEGAGPTWSFAVPSPSDYGLSWSDWVLPMGVERPRLDAPRIRYRLEFPREQDTDQSPIPACL